MLFDVFKNKLEGSKYFSNDGTLLRNKVLEDIEKHEEDLFDILVSTDELKKQFFIDVKGQLIFDKDKFRNFINNKEFLKNSYTSFRNKIGLGVDDGYLSEDKRVVLNFPYKDCILEGGQTKEDQKKNEIFYNEILAPDEVTRIKEPKVLTNFKKYTANGEQEVKDISIDDNLIIKGNNLLALYSLREKYAGKVKCIYIDPPYNPPSSNNTFSYNNNFNRSTWLTFMKNRLVIARNLLTDNGALIVAIDDNEHAYLSVLLDEMFPSHDRHCITIEHNPRGIQGKNFSYTHEYAIFMLPKGYKLVNQKQLEETEVEWSNFRNWGSESLRSNAKNCFYPIIVKDDVIIGFGDVLDNECHPTSAIEVKNGLKYYYPIDKNMVERKWRYARQTVEEVKHLLKVKNGKNSSEIQIGKDFGIHKTVWTGSRYDANSQGAQLLRKLVPNAKFSFPKSVYNVLDCLNAIVKDDKDAIVLDYHAGSGTTAHAVLSLNQKDNGNRKFILIEQMNYVESVTAKRVQSVLEEDSFIYCELAKWNENLVDEINTINNSKKAIEVLNEIKQVGYLNYKVDLDKIDIEEFKKLEVEEQKKILIDFLDLNHLYVNLNDIEDENFEIDDKVIKLNEKFYGDM